MLGHCKIHHAGLVPQHARCLRQIKKEAGAGFKPVPTGIPLSFLRRGIGRGSSRSRQKGRKRAIFALDLPYYKLQTPNSKPHSAPPCGGISLRSTWLWSAFEKEIDQVYYVTDRYFAVTIDISYFQEVRSRSSPKRIVDQINYICHSNFCIIVSIPADTCEESPGLTGPSFY